MPAGAILTKTKVLSQHQSLRHIAILFSGKAGVYLIALLSQPVLARLYSPAQFGEFAFLNSILAILLIGASGRYEEGIIITKKFFQAQKVFQLCQVLLAGYFVVLSLATFFTPAGLLLYLQQKGINPHYFWFLPFLVLFSGYWQIVHQWLIRSRKFTQISIALIAQRLIIFLSALIAAFLSFQGNGIILGLLIGSAGIFVTALFLHREPLLIPLKRLQPYAYHFRKFPYFTTPSLLITLLIQHLPVLWLNYFYNMEITGSYSMAYTLITLPLISIVFSTTQVYYERLAQSTKSRQFEIIKNLVFSFTLVLLPIALILFIWGEQLTVLLLDVKWRDTGRIVSILAPTILFQGLSNCLTLPIPILQKQSLSFIFQCIKIVLWLIALGAGYYLQDVFLTFKLMSIFSLLYLLVIVKVMYPLIKY